MDMDWKVKVELSAPRFMAVYESVRRLASFHKVEQADCEAMALVAVVEHPGRVQAAIREARRALNGERRQRFPARPIDDRTDGGQEEPAAMEIETDTRTLPRKLSAALSRLDDEGQSLDEDEDRSMEIEAEDREAGHELPQVSPHDLMTAIIFWADRGADTDQIAERVGRTAARIRQILRDPDAIRRAVEMADAQKEIPGLECGPGSVQAPREPIRHKPRAGIQAGIQADNQLSFLQMEEDLV